MATEDELRMCCSCFDDFDKLAIRLLNKIILVFLRTYYKKKDY